MKHFVIGLLFLTKLSLASDSHAEEQEKIIFRLANMRIKAIQEKADAGDVNSTLAFVDFFESVKDKNYKIDYPASKEILVGHNLLDEFGKVHNAVRKAFQKFANKNTDKE